jgi:glycosyltransferase involved in cell wall biosynthesis
MNNLKQAKNNFKTATEINQNIQIAHIVTYPSLGQKHSNFSALAGYTKNLIDGFDEKDRAKQVVLSNIKTVEGEKPEVKSFKFDGVLVEEIWQRGSLMFWWPIFKYLKANKQIKVVHLQHEFNMFGGLLSIILIPWLLFLIRIVLNRKITSTFHEIFSPKLINKNFMQANNLDLPVWIAKVVFYFYFQLTILLFVDKVIVHDDFFKNILKNEYHFTKKVQTIAHGVEDLNWSITQTEARQKLGLAKDKKVLMFFGFLAGYKGVELLIEGFKKLENRENYQLIIAGGKVKRVANDPRYQTWLNKIMDDCKTLGIQTPGFVKNEDIETYFRASDLLILPYLTPQSMSGIMAMAVGFKQPFLASSSFKERVDDEWLFDLNPQALANKVDWFFENYSHQEEMISYLKVIRQQRLWTVIATQSNQIYNQLLSA